MQKRLMQWVLAAIAVSLLAMQPTAARDQPLVSVEWLQKRLGGEITILDTSMAPTYAEKHIPGAVRVNFYSYGALETTAADMERRIVSWGVSPGRKVVLYDEGGTFMATRVFYDLYQMGFPLEDLAVLDGGLARWEAAGAPVTRDPTPKPEPGTFRVTGVKEDVQVRLPEFLVATGDPANHAVVEALEPSYHFGGANFFGKGGHIPNGISLPSEDFFNADKTFKSPEEIGRMLAYLGVKREQQVHSYCGGGVSAAIPFFAMKFLLDYPRVKLYKGSQREWLRDDRGLPVWTYDAPNVKREMEWVSGWNNPMMRTFGVAQMNIIDIRSADAYSQGHVPYALSIPADVFRSRISDPARLAESLGQAGVNPADEAVIVSNGKLNERSALAYLVLDALGHKRVSVLMGSVDDWGLKGLPITKDATIVGRPKSPRDAAVPPVTYVPSPREGVLIRDANATKGLYPKVFIASGKTRPASAPAGRVIHVPYTDLLNADGTPKAAKDIWNVLVKAGVPRYAEIIVFADDPGEAAVNYYILKLMGFPDVKVLLT